jgi:hypothetical protein
LERCAIDPALCPRQRTDFNAATFSLNDAIIDVEFLKEAEMIDANLATMTSGRHKLFFRLGVFLARAGLAREEIQARLFGCAGQETKMQRKVPGVLKSLEEYGWIVRF